MCVILEVDRRYNRQNSPPVGSLSWEAINDDSKVVRWQNRTLNSVNMKSIRTVDNVALAALMLLTSFLFKRQVGGERLSINNVMFADGCQALQTTYLGGQQGSRHRF